MIFNQIIPVSLSGHIKFECHLILDQCLHCMLTSLGFRGSWFTRSFISVNCSVTALWGWLHWRGQGAPAGRQGPQWDLETGISDASVGEILSPDWALAMCSTPRWLCPHSYILWKEPRCSRAILSELLLLLTVKVKTFTEAIPTWSDP